jgi:hypothetical protein
MNQFRVVKSVFFCVASPLDLSGSADKTWKLIWSGLGRLLEEA